MEDIGDNLPMDPMVDVVFLLLVFFLFNFQIKLLEVRIPVDSFESGGGVAAEPQELPHVSLSPNPSGDLAQVRLNGQLVASLDDLQRRLGQADEAAELVLDTDPHLKYAPVVGVLDRLQQSGWHVRLATRNE